MPIMRDTHSNNGRNIMEKLLFILIWAYLATLTACNSSNFAGGSNKGSSNKRPDKLGTDQGTGDSDADADGNDGDGGDTDSKDDGDIANSDGDGGDDSASDNSDADIQIDEGEKVNCEKDEEKIAPGNENFTFNTGAEVRTFVNERCKTGISAKFAGAGSVGSDADTAEAVCNLKGFKTGTVQESGKYSSPNDNFIAYWDKAQTKFILAGASGRNSNIRRLLCDGKFKKECIDEKKKIDCVF